MSTIVSLQRIASHTFQRGRFIRSSYGDFDTLVGRYVAHLHEQPIKIRPGSPVILPPDKSEGWVALFFAILRQRGIVVPWHASATSTFKDAIVIGQVPRIEDIPSHATVTDEPNGPPLPDDIALYLYTSGTTSNPKIVPLSHNNIVSNLTAINIATQNIAVNQDDEYLSILPWSHCYALTCELLYGMSHGARITPTTPDSFYKDILISRPSLLCGVPKLYQVMYNIAHNTPLLNRVYSMCDSSSVALSVVRKCLFGGRLRMATSGGAYLPQHLSEFMRKLGIPLIEGYGMTEASPMVSLNVNRVPGSVGKILSCNDVSITLTGQIHVSGKNVFKGYLSEEPLQGGFPTGDGGYVDDDGNLFLTGRFSERYKLSNGKYVNAEVIEGYILKYFPHHVAQVCVCASYCGGYNVALVVHKGTQSIDIDICRRLLFKHLDHYELPKKIVCIQEPFTVENGCLTSKQTLRRRNIVERYTNRLSVFVD